MKKSTKSFFCILVCTALILSFAFSSFAAYTNTAEAQRFNDDGTFRIMHVTDTHLEYYNLDASTYLIASACDREKPDMIVLTGDIAMSNDKTEMDTCIDRLMGVFEDREIPVAVCFGNHDMETTSYTNPSDLMALYNSYECSISVDEGDILTGCGTYNIPILASGSDTLKFNIWVFDSGSSDGEGHYSNVPDDQVEWYKTVSAQIEQENGKVNSLAFQHIIVPEIYDALQKHDSPKPFAYEHIYNKGEYYSFNPELENHGVLNEKPCPGYYNHGQFAAMVDRGDVLGIFTGHDHTNDFSVKYQGINITNSLSTRYNGDAFSSQYGYRIIDINEADTSTYTTRAVHWYDYFTLGDVFELSRSGDKYGSGLAFSVLFQGFFQKFADEFAATVVYMFTGRQCAYN